MLTYFDRKFRVPRDILAGSRRNSSHMFTNSRLGAFAAA